jgi:hypothetical protein
MVARLDGPLHFRFIVQPLVAVVFAIVDGLKDARTGKPAYLWAVVTTPAHRAELVRDGWRSVGKIFIVATVLDAVYQLAVQRTLYPVEILVVALMLAVIPYAVLRGPVNRVARLWWS